MIERHPAPAPSAPAPRFSVIPAELVPERRGAVSFLSSVERDGDWILPRHFRAVAFLGSVELDLTRARVGPGTSLMELVAVLGSVTVVVPPGLRVECEGDPILGSVEVKRDAPTTADADGPLLRVTVTVVMGDVTVRVVDPDAPGWIEKIRARLAGG